MSPRKSKERDDEKVEKDMMNMTVKNIYNINIICGSDDGMMTTHNFSHVINQLYEDVNTNDYTESKPLSYGYNPYYNAQGKYIRKFDFFRALWPHGNSKTLFNSIPESALASQSTSMRNIDTHDDNGSNTNDSNHNDNDNNKVNDNNFSIQNNSLFTPSKDSPTAHFKPPFFSKNKNDNNDNHLNNKINDSDEQTNSLFVPSLLSPSHHFKPSAFSKNSNNSNINNNENINNNNNYKYSNNNNTYNKNSKNFDINIKDFNRPLNCELQSVFGDRTGSFLSMDIVGDNSLILTASSERTIQLWTLQGDLTAVLTRGKKWDKVLPPFWKKPIDMSQRDNLRDKKTEIMVKVLNLENLIINEKNEKVQKNSVDYKHNEIYFLSKTSIVDEMRTVLQNNATSEKGKTEKPEVALYDDLYSKAYLSLPDRERVLKQFTGQITYPLSAKDYAKLKLRQGKDKELLRLQTGSDKKMRKKNQKKKFNVDDVLVDAEKAEFTNEIMRLMKEKDDRSSYMSGRIGTNGLGSGGTIGHEKNNYEKKKSYLLKSVYESELLGIEANDPNNWEINSKNRQRELYSSLYHEYDNMGMNNSALDVINGKIRRLVPERDVKRFEETIGAMPMSEYYMNQKNKTPETLKLTIGTAPSFMSRPPSPSIARSKSPGIRIFSRPQSTLKKDIVLADNMKLIIDEIKESDEDISHETNLDDEIHDEKIENEIGKIQKIENRNENKNGNCLVEINHEIEIFSKIDEIERIKDPLKTMEFSAESFNLIKENKYTDILALPVSPILSISMIQTTPTKKTPPPIITPLDSVITSQAISIKTSPQSMMSIVNSIVSSQAPLQKASEVQTASIIDIPTTLAQAPPLALPPPLSPPNPAFKAGKVQQSAMITTIATPISPLLSKKKTFKDSKISYIRSSSMGTTYNSEVRSSHSNVLPISNSNVRSSSPSKSQNSFAGKTDNKVKSDIKSDWDYNDNISEEYDYTKANDEFENYNIKKMFDNGNDMNMKNNLSFKLSRKSTLKKDSMTVNSNYPLYNPVHTPYVLSESSLFAGQIPKEVLSNNIIFTEEKKEAKRNKDTILTSIQKFEEAVLIAEKNYKKSMKISKKKLMKKKLNFDSNFDTDVLSKSLDVHLRANLDSGNFFSETNNSVEKIDIDNKETKKINNKIDIQMIAKKNFERKIEYTLNEGNLSGVDTKDEMKFDEIRKNFSIIRKKEKDSLPIL